MSKNCCIAVSTPEMSSRTLWEKIQYILVNLCRKRESRWMTMKKYCFPVPGEVICPHIKISADVYRPESLKVNQASGEVGSQRVRGMELVDITLHKNPGHD